VVVCNASDETTTPTLAATIGNRYRLHPVQASGRDPVVRTGTHDARTGQSSLPARTVAVFVDR
jgi:hypothetical protein